MSNTPPEGSPPSPPTDELFHYTSLGGFQGIIESNTIHATSIRYLNDRKEMAFANHLIRQHIFYQLQSRYAAFADEDLEIFRQIDDLNGVPFKCYFDLHDAANSCAQLEADSVMRDLEANSAKNPIFVSCFCTHEQDFERSNGLLSQWRGYGDGGVAICFSAEGISSLIERECAAFFACTAFVRQIDYVDEDHIPDKYRDALKFFAAAPNEFIRSRSIRRLGMSPGEPARLWEIYAMDGWRSYTDIAPCLKHWGFKEELEHRLVFALGHEHLNEVRRNGRPDKEIRFRQSGRYLTPFVALNSDPKSQRNGSKDHKLPVTRVIVGPSPEPERRLDGVRWLLKQKGHNVDVRLSEIPFA